MYLEYQIGGKYGQVSELYIWNASIELEGICKFCPLDKILPKSYAQFVMKNGRRQIAEVETLAHG